jgi:hypothetical protein
MITTKLPATSIKVGDFITPPESTGIFKVAEIEQPGEYRLRFGFDTGKYCYLRVDDEVTVVSDVCGRCVHYDTMIMADDYGYPEKGRCGFPKERMPLSFQGYAQRERELVESTATGCPTWEQGS